MNAHPCGNCGTLLNTRFLDGRRVFQCPKCAYNHTAQTPTGDVRRAVESPVNPEAIIGSGGPRWSVTASGRTRDGRRFQDDFHVRAATEAGARALGQEMRPDAERIDVLRVDDA